MILGSLAAPLAPDVAADIWGNCPDGYSGYSAADGSTRCSLAMSPFTPPPSDTTPTVTITTPAKITIDTTPGVYTPPVSVEPAPGFTIPGLPPTVNFGGQKISTGMIAAFFGIAAVGFYLLRKKA